ncbi:hypothetical protein IM40_07135 [Candidatus Paracaedimonas acanthamoebae]|nr:hypothetical protein IM40_07135 [Candidatus Paracaedimonas acanthamoebae]
MKRWFLILALTSFLSWGLGLLWFANSIQKDVLPPEQPTDAIIVLTGGAERVATGLSLLSRGLAQRLFISGVHEQVKIKDLLSQIPLNEREKINPATIDLGYAAANTTQNAQETAQWVRKNHIQTLRLVTANYHMRRSLLEFSQRLPEVQIIPHPISPKNFHDKMWWQWPGTFDLMIREYHKLLGALGQYCLRQLTLKGISALS